MDIQIALKQTAGANNDPGDISSSDDNMYDNAIQQFDDHDELYNVNPNTSSPQSPQSPQADDNDDRGFVIGMPRIPQKIMQ